MSEFAVDPEAHTITATRSLRPAGGSHTLTIPPAILETIGAEAGDDLQLVAHMDTGVIEVSKVSEGSEE